MPELFRATVDHLSEKGYGTVKDPEGKTLFVRGVWPGDEGLFERIEGEEPNGRLHELTKASADRREVACQHWGLAEHNCFGCPWMLASYEAQLIRKEHRLRYALERLKVPTGALKAIWAAPSPFAYRSRAQFKTDGRQLGYAGLHGESIAPVASCLVLSPTLSSHLTSLHAALPLKDWEPEAPHIWNFIDLDEESDLSRLTLNRRRPFSQVHKGQNLRMRGWIDAKIGDAQGKSALELFAGSGNFTEVLASKGLKDIRAWEVGRSAIDALKAKKLPAVYAEAVDLYKAAGRMRIRREASHCTILVVNPPRAGLQQLARIPEDLPRLEQILYISCDVGTLAQDLKKLMRYGFQLAELQPLDQMPHTPHVEVLVELRR